MASMEYKIWIRAFHGLPFLIIIYCCYRTFGTVIDAMISSIPSDGDLTKLILYEGLVIPRQTKFFGLKGLDDFLALYVGVFTPAIADFDPVGRLQAVGFLADIVPMYIIWTIEGARRGNHGTAAYWLWVHSSRIMNFWLISCRPNLLGLASQIIGIGYVAPFYYLLHYLQCPSTNRVTAANRTTELSISKFLIPTMTFTYILPAIWMFTTPDLSTKQWVFGLFWQNFPLYLALLQSLLGILTKNSTKEDQIRNQIADLTYIHLAYAFSATVGFCAYSYIRFSSVSFFTIFFSDLNNPSQPLPLIKAAVKMLRYDYISCFSSSTVWVFLHFKDLKESGLLKESWWRILAFFLAVVFLAGPGAAMACMWAVRENALAEKEEAAVGKSD